MTDASPISIAESLSRAQRCLLENKTQEAIAYCEGVLKQDPSQHEAIHLLALLKTRSGLEDEAFKLVLHGIQFHPENPVLHNHLGNLYRRRGDVERARFHLEKAILIEPLYAEAFNNLGILSFYTQAFEEALMYYQRAVDVDPNYVDAHYNLGQLHFRLGHYEDAERILRAMIKLFSQHAESFYLLGILTQMDDRLKESETFYLRAIALKADHLEAWNNLAALYQKQGRTVDALKGFAKVLEFSPDHREARSNLAASFLLSERYDEALSQYEILLEAEPKNLDYLYNTGVAFMSQGRFEEALRAYWCLLALDNRHFEAHNNMGYCYGALGHRTDAAVHYRKAHELHPDDESVQYLLHALEGDQCPTRAPSDFVKKLFGPYAKHYEHHLEKELAYRVPARVAEVLETLLEKEKQFSILDLGCGTGLVGQALKSRAHRLVGIDVSPEMLTVAKQKSIYDDLIEGDVETVLRRLEEPFQIAIAAEVFVYIGELQQIFCELARVLCGGGWFVFTTEIAQTQPYELEASGRFSHQPAFIHELALQTGFECVTQEDIILRTHRAEPLPGFLYVLRKF